MKKFWKFFLLIIIVVLVGFWWRDNSYRNDLELIPGGDGGDVLFKIDKGEGVGSVSRRLGEDGLIVSQGSFLRFLEEEGKDSQVKAGRYILQRDLTIPEIIEILTNNEAEQLRVRLPEGFTIAQMDEWLAGKNMLGEGEFLECASSCDFSSFGIMRDEPSNVKQRLEGYLFPDTYFHEARSVDAEKIIGRALLEMQEKLKKLEVDENIHDILTIASLIEKETWTDEEKPLVAGVLWGRLGDGMRLDVDATTRYAVGKPKEPLTKEDLKSDDPYNTRKAWGMPPGPIGAFSYASLAAAVNPKETSYRYYLHDKDGRVHFARTLEGHNQNVADWLR